MDDTDSPLLEPAFDCELFDAYVEESNSCWMPDLWLEHAKTVFAYFYYYVIGPVGTAPDERAALLDDFLGQMKNVTSEEEQKHMRNLIKSLFWADAFCSACYKTYEEATNMPLPCGL